MAEEYKQWKKNLSEETDFWNRWLQTRGLSWPDQFVERTDPETLISGYYSRFIDPIEKDTIDILDIGAGPLTILGKKHPTKKLQITAVDPLAKEYDKLLKRYRITPPVRTIFGEAEKLDRLFAPDRFDLVTAVNCIDHSHDPLAAIQQMLRVARVNRVVFLSHQENEGEINNYQGLHQFNLTAVNGEFVVKTKLGQIVNVSRELASAARVECQLVDHWLNVIITKL